MGHQFPCFRHKLTTAEVRKKSHHSQQTGVSTPSPVASGSGSCWKQESNPAGPNPATIESRSLRPFHYRVLLYLPLCFPPLWNSAYVIGTGSFSFLAVQAVVARVGHTRKAWQSRKEKPSPRQKSQDQLCVSPKKKPFYWEWPRAVCMGGRWMIQYVCQCADFLDREAEKWGFPIACAFFCEALCKILPHFPHLVQSLMVFPFFCLVNWDV